MVRALEARRFVEPLSHKKWLQAGRSEVPGGPTCREAERAGSLGA